jgi:hypothetical protein
LAGQVFKVKNLSEKTFDGTPSLILQKMSFSNRNEPNNFGGFETEKKLSNYFMTNVASPEKRKANFEQISILKSCEIVFAQSDMITSVVEQINSSNSIFCCIFLSKHPRIL